MVQASAAPAFENQKPHEAPTAAQSPSWSELLNAKTSCLILPRMDAEVSAAAEYLATKPNVSLRIMGEKQALLSAIHADLPAPLAFFIADLLDDYEAFMNADIMRIRLETVTSRACWKWHRDYTTLRLITTLCGDGTEYLPDPAQPDAIVRAATGDIGLFKGRLFGNHFGLEGHAACVHRSPPWTDDSCTRLLLVIDMPQDFEIEDAAR
ncbi:MAG: DUF1826 domain-containing protein [Pseudomonadota bacterium]